jgi:hypothetical protein
MQIGMIGLGRMGAGLHCRCRLSRLHCSPVSAPVARPGTKISCCLHSVSNSGAISRSRPDELCCSTMENDYAGNILTTHKT